MIELLIYPLAAGILLCCATGPLGCFVVWRKMAYFGDTIAHASLLGLGLGVALKINQTFAVIFVCVLLSVALSLKKSKSKLSSDTILGIVAHGSLALGLLVFSMIADQKINLQSILMGDILTVDRFDIILIGVCVLATNALILFFKSTLLLWIIDEDISKIEKAGGEYITILLGILTAVAIAIGVQIVGVLLVSSLLIVPAATARNVSYSPEAMIIYATIFGILAVASGTLSSALYDLPTGPAMIVASLALFVLSHLYKKDFKSRA